jgi:eukaryotic-like serine/threonine-protein kinase
MNGIPPPDRSGIDAIVNRFERAWQVAPPSPRIEDYLAEADPEQSAALFKELLEAERTFCERAGLTVRPGDYHLRFPEFAPLIDSAFGTAAPATVDAPSTTDEHLPSDAHWQGPVTQIGPYKLLQQIGSGGMGTVCIAEQEKPVRRRVALKIIKPGMDTAQVVARFEAERQALALMDHPHIAKVLDAGASDSGHPFFVMDLVKGVPITQYCDQNRLSLAERLQLFMPVCHAIQHAHQKGIIHRDIKPSNVLVMISDGKPLAKVIDFGVAKATDQRLTERTIFTQLGQIVGTLEYMSPEQAEMGALDIDTRTDIYSLGIVLYELLTGSTPLERTKLRQISYDEILRRIRDGETPRPSTRLSHSGEALVSISAQRNTEPSRLARLLRGELDWIVMKALEKDRTRRYETANGLARDIQRYLDGDAVEAGPPSAIYRLSRFSRKHRVALGSLAAFATLLMIGIGVSLWLTVRARQAERRAFREAHRALEAEKVTAAERDRALAAEARSRAINEFLTHDLLQQAEPSYSAADQNVTLLEVLNRASAKVGERFHDQPAVEAAVRETIANTYGELGVYDQAEVHYRALAEIERLRLGTDSAEAWWAFSRLGAALVALGRTQEGSALLEKACDGLRRTAGPEHRKTLEAQTELGGAYVAAGQYSLAVQVLKDALVKARRSSALGPGELPDIMNSLAIAYRYSDCAADATALHEEALPISRGALGPEHPITLRVMNQLGQDYVELGRADKAIPVLEEALRIKKARLGPDHPGTISSMATLAWTYFSQLQLDKAIPLYEQTAKLYKAKLGPDHPYTLNTLVHLGQAYCDAGRIQNAEKLMAEALPVLQAKFGPDYAETLAATAILIDVYTVNGRWSDAESLAEKSLEIYTKKAPDDWRRFDAMVQLGAALAGSKKYSAAQPLLIGGYEGMKSRAHNIPAPSKKLLIKALESIVNFYDTWGKPDQAREWRKKLEAAKASAAPTQAESAG